MQELSAMRFVEKEIQDIQEQLVKINNELNRQAAWNKAQDSDLASVRTQAARAAADAATVVQDYVGHEEENTWRKLRFLSSLMLRLRLLPSW